MTSLRAEKIQSSEAGAAGGNSPAHTGTLLAAVMSCQISPARDGAAETTWQEEPLDEGWRTIGLAAASTALPVNPRSAWSSSS